MNTCKNCGEIFESRRSKAEFCGSSCVNKYHKNDDIVTKVCPSCSSEFNLSYYKRHTTVHCSYACAMRAKWEGWREQGRDKEITNKISKAHKEGYATGRIERRFGEKAPNWQGGKTEVARGIRTCAHYAQWRLSVFERDKFTCCSCGVSGGDLNADHIKPFHSILKENNIKSVEQAIECEKLWDVENGRTLCVACHKKTETYGGKARV